MAYVFLGLVMTEVISTQPWFIGNFQPGQLFGWVNIAVFAAIIFLTPGLARGFRLFIALIFIGKLGLWMTGRPALDAVFRGGLLASAGVCGMIVALEASSMVRRQVSIMMIASAPLMFLQMAGAGAWTQALTTHGIQGDGTSVPKEGVRTLFVSSYDLAWSKVNNVQMRPAGFLHASEFASLIIVFALVLTLASPGPRKKLAEFSVCAASVISMAKILLLTGAVTIVWITLTGTPRMKERARDYALWFVLLLVAYRIFFPGLFVNNLGYEAFALSLLGRAYEVASMIGYGAVIDRQLYEVFSQTVASDESTTLSGIAQLFRYLPYVLAAATVAIPAFFFAHRRMSRLSPIGTRTAVVMLMALSLFLVAGPFLHSPAYWFCLGFGMFPLMSVVDPRYVQSLLRRAKETPVRRATVRSAPADTGPSTEASPA